LVTYAGGSSRAGAKLKAMSGWNSDGNGTDDHGFSALPGGRCGSDGGFNDVGDFGYWWSTRESKDFDGNAYYRYMLQTANSVISNDYDKSYLFSVRCLQD